MCPGNSPVPVPVPGPRPNVDCVWCPSMQKAHLLASLLLHDEGVVAPHLPLLMFLGSTVCPKVVVMLGRTGQKELWLGSRRPSPLTLWHLPIPFFPRALVLFFSIKKRGVSRKKLFLKIFGNLSSNKKTQ